MTDQIDNELADFEYFNKKKSQDQQLEIEAENNEAINEAILEEEIQNQNIIDQENATQNFPAWTREIVDVTMEYESRFPFLNEAQRTELHQGVEDTLNYLLGDDIIKSFEATQNGFKAMLEGGNHLNFNLDSHLVNLNSFSDKAMQALTSVVSYVGDKLDIGPLKDPAARLSAWKNASDVHLDLKGFNPGEETGLKEALSSAINIAAPSLGIK